MRSAISEGNVPDSLRQSDWRHPVEDVPSLRNRYSPSEQKHHLRQFRLLDPVYQYWEWTYPQDSNQEQRQEHQKQHHPWLRRLLAWDLRLDLRRSSPRYTAPSISPGAKASI